jgi:hypothetical protein
MQDILDKYGLLGYGLYWYCTERICKFFEIPNSYECLLQDSTERLARKFGLEEVKLLEMLEFFVKVGAFSGSRDKGFSNTKLYQRMDRYSHQTLKQSGVHYDKKSTSLSDMFEMLEELRKTGKITHKKATYAPKSTQGVHKNTQGVHNMRKNVLIRDKIRQDNIIKELSKGPSKKQKPLNNLAEREESKKPLIHPSVGPMEV